MLVGILKGIINWFLAGVIREAASLLGSLALLPPRVSFVIIVVVNNLNVCFFYFFLICNIMFMFMWKIYS